MQKAYVGSVGITTKVFAPGNGQCSVIELKEFLSPFFPALHFATYMYIHN